jgi:hypothetical protein
MNTVVLTFDPSGQGSCLYSELIDLRSLGSLEVSRATTIEFNNTCQFWEVEDPRGTVLYFSRSRTACLAWEHQDLNR